MGWRARGYGNPGELLHVADSVRFYGDGINFQALWPNFLTQGPSLCDVHCLAKMKSSKKDSGRLVGHMGWHLLSPFGLSWILRLGSSLLVKITQARPYHQPWPGWAVLLNGFPNSNTAHQYSICPQFNFMWRYWPSAFDGRHGHMIHSAKKCKENWYVSYLDGRISLL